MDKRIQAYFRTESEAESVRIKLKKYETKDMLMDELGEPMGADDRLLVPLAAAAPTSSAGVAGSNYGAGGVIPQRGLGAYVGMHEAEEATDHDGEPHNLHFVISAKVKKEDYDEVVKTIRSNHGYLEKDLDDE